MDKNHKYVLNGFKIIIVLTTGFYLYKQLSGITFPVRDGQLSVSTIWEILPFPFYLLVSVFLCPLNWMFEARKWQIAILFLQPISFYQSFKAIITAIPLGFITPGNLGDYPGRTLYLEKQNRFTGVFLTFCCRAAQMYITSLAGLTVAVLFYVYYVQNFYILLVIAGAFVILFAYSVFFFNYHYLYQKISSYKKVFTWVRKFLPEKNYVFLIRGKILFYSLSRYVIIILQFVLIFKALGSELDYYTITIGAILVMLIKSFIPVFRIFNDLGVREAATVFVFNFFFISPLISISASVLLWSVNFVIPLCVGLFYIAMFK